MRLSPKAGWSLLKEAIQAWSNDYAPSMGAALSYYTLFSIAPLFLIVIAVAGWFFGEAAVRGELTGALEGLMGEQGARAIEGLLASVSKPEEGIIATVIGVLVLILGATTVFGELQNNLDRIWRAPPRKEIGSVWKLLRSRLLSIGMILGIAFLLMVSLALDAVLQLVGKLWGTGAWQVFAQLLNTIVAFALTTTVFAMIYKLMPRAKIAWRDVWVGAAVTALLFTIGKFLIGLYIGRSAVASSFGAAASLVVVMVWVYYSAQIFLLGAEFTWVYAHTYGSRREPVSGPVPTPAPVRVVPAPLPPMPTPTQVPVLKRKPLLAFGIAAALGALAGIVLRTRPDLVFHRARAGLFSRLKLR
jgi:membrane protein